MRIIHQYLGALALWFSIAAIMGGCASEPFVRPPLPILNHPDPRAMVEAFANKTPATFTSDDTVILHAPFHDELAVLGVLHVDRKARSFELYGLNQLGVEFFHLSGDHNTVSIRSAIGPLMEHRDILLSMGRDIMRMYFDLEPPADAKVSIRRTEVRFTETTPDGAVVRSFGGDPAILLEKHQDGFFGFAWRVRYFDYRPQANAMYPHIIVMDNGHYHYRITAKNRDWSSAH